MNIKMDIKPAQCSSLPPDHLGHATLLLELLLLVLVLLSCLRCHFPQLFLQMCMLIMTVRSAHDHHSPAS